MNRMTRRELIQAGVVGLAAAATPTGAAGPSGAGPGREFSFHYDHVIGTSLDGWVLAADEAAAARAERAALEEIERLRGVFSPFDPDSELSRLNRASGAFAASADLLAVLREYEAWGRRSGGACSGQLGGLMRLWAEADRTGARPDARALRPLVRRVGAAGWRRDEGRGTVTRGPGQVLNLNSVAKGYILHKAAEAVRAAGAGVGGLLLDLGGDMTVWGGGWSVGVHDPRAPEENARPLTALRLADAAVATSGGYQRYFTVEGVRYSHLLDPGTGRPTAGVLAATVVAPTSVVANVLATTLCVLDPDEGLRLVHDTPGAECLILTPDGPLRSRRFAALEVPLPPAPAVRKVQGEGTKAGAGEKMAPWPAEHKVSIALEIPRPSGGRRARRPYVAVWVEDASGKAVRTVTVWGNSQRWLPTMSGWWKVARSDKALIKSVTRATRAPGKYTVVWDGKDDKGQALPQGTYTVRVEVHREHGKHLFQTGKITCGGEAATVTLKRNAEAGDTVITYGKSK